MTAKWHVFMTADGRISMAGLSGAPPPPGGGGGAGAGGGGSAAMGGRLGVGRSHRLIGRNPALLPD